MMTPESPSRTLQREYRARLSAMEEVCVREYRHKTPSPTRRLFSLEVLHSRDDGRTWRQLPLRLSPASWLKNALLDIGWPPEFATRLTCEDGVIALQFINRDYFYNWPLKAWRATYDPRRRRWYLQEIRTSRRTLPLPR